MKLFEVFPATAIAVVDIQNEKTQEWSYQQFQELFDGFVRQLNTSGLRQGDAITVLAANNAQSIAFILASLSCGLRVAPLNRQLTVTEIEQQHHTLGASKLFYDSSLVYSLKGLDVLLQVFEPDFSDKSPVFSDIAGELCFFTSATTGKAKAVLRHQQDKCVDELFEDWRNKGVSLGLNGDGAHLLVGPSYHAAPLLYALFDFLNGARLVIMPKWQLPDVLAVIEAYQITHSHFVPTYFKRALELTEQQRSQYNLSSLKRVYHGAAPISPELKKRCIDWLGPVLIEYWGASECGTCCLVDSLQWLAKPGTVGQAVNNVEIQIRDDTGEVLAANQQGKIFARFKHNKQPFSYLNEPEKTKATLDQFGWFQLGDIGYLDDQAYLFLSGRESHTIISGGVNIYPAEIEAVLLEHPKIEDVLIYAKPDQDKGEKVAALIQCKNDIDLADLQQFMQDKLASYKWPRFWYFCRELPVNEAGKVTRSALLALNYL